MACRSFRSEAALLGLTSRALDGASMPFAEPGVQPHYGPSRTTRIEHVDVSLDLQIEARRFEGEARITFVALPTFAGELALDLDDCVVDEVTAEDGTALEWRHEDDTLRVRGLDGGGTVVVKWHGDKPTRGLYFTGPEAWAPDRPGMAWTQCQDEDAHFLMPCHDHPSAKHTWTVRLRGPAGTTLLGNGEEVEQGEDERGAWAVFEQRKPMPAYLFVAVAAELVVETTEWEGRPVRYLVPPGEDAQVLHTFGKTPIMLDAFSAVTGVAYPWPRYDQVVVHDFIFGGMENVACTVMTDLLLVDEANALEWDPDRLVCHELAHQWFGDLLTCQDWSQAWLNESWATFMEVVWWEHDREEVDSTWYAYSQFLGYLGEDGGRYRRPIVSYDFREPIDVFDRHLYEKGARVLDTLRTTLGATAFWAGVQLYLERHRHQTVHTRHFQRAMEDATGQNLDRFFDQWIHGAGHPALEVKLAAEDGLLTVGIKQTQSGERTAEAFHLPLSLEIVFEDGQTRKVTLPIRERERSWAVPVDGEVATVRVDPGFTVAATIALEAPRGWLERLATDECPVLSARAIAALLKSGTPKATAAAHEATRTHPAWQVRAHLATALGKRGGEAERDVLLAMLGEDDPRVRRAAAEALGAWRDTAVADALLDVAAQEDRGTDFLRKAVLESLGKTRDPRAADALRAHLDVESWGDMVANGAAAGLAWTEDESVLDDIIACTHLERRPRVRAGAAVALGILGDRVDAARKRCVERLVEMTSEPGFRTQLAALGALGRIRAVDAIPALTNVHRTAADGRTRRVAYEALYAVRQGRTTEEGLSALRRRVESLGEENAKLRGRLEKLERVTE